MRDLNHDGSGLRHWVSTSWREVVNARIVRWAVRLSSAEVRYLWGIRAEDRSPRAEHRSIDDASHLTIPMARPDAVAAAIDDLIDRA